MLFFLPLKMYIFILYKLNYIYHHQKGFLIPLHLEQKKNSEMSKINENNMNTLTSFFKN